MVRSVPFLLLVAIFVPKVNTQGTFSEAPICAFDAEGEVTHSLTPMINSCRQDQNHEFLDLDQCEFDLLLCIREDFFRERFRSC